MNLDLRNFKPLQLGAIITRDGRSYRVVEVYPEAVTIASLRNPKETQRLDIPKWMRGDK